MSRSADGSPSVSGEAPAHHGRSEPLESPGSPRQPRPFSPGASVALLRPRKLRGTIGIIRRRMTGGWEVEIRSAAGVPLHLTLPERALHLRS